MQWQIVTNWILENEVYCHILCMSTLLIKLYNKQGLIGTCITIIRTGTGWHVSKAILKYFATNEQNKMKQNNSDMAYLPSGRTVCLALVLKVRNVLDHPFVDLWQRQTFFRNAFDRFCNQIGIWHAAPGISTWWWLLEIYTGLCCGTVLLLLMGRGTVIQPGAVIQSPAVCQLTVPSVRSTS